MNLRKYYESVKETRKSLSEPYVYLTSKSTPNGGVAGVVTEVETDIAAKMIVDGVASPSEEHEIAACKAKREADRIRAKEEEMRNRVRITLVNEPAFHFDNEKPEKAPKNRS